MNWIALFAAAFCWAVAVVPLAAGDWPAAVIPGTDGRKLFDGSQADGPMPPADPAVAAASGSGAGVAQGLKTAGDRQGGLNVGAAAVPAPAAGAGSRHAGSGRGFCNGSLREFDRRVGKVPVLRELISIILLPVVVYCTLTN